MLFTGKYVLLLTVLFFSIIMQDLNLSSISTHSKCWVVLNALGCYFGIITVAFAIRVWGSAIIALNVALNFAKTMRN